MMTPARSATPTARRSQKERRESTRRRLLEAAEVCLVERGHAGTTTTEVVARAGLSQGALFRHFPTKASLLAATAAHLFEGLVASYRVDLQALTGDGRQPAERVALAFELLWKIFEGPRLVAAFELYMGARTDAALSAALTPVVQAHRAALRRHARALFPEFARLGSHFDDLIDLLMCAMEGIVVERYGAPGSAEGALRALRGLALAQLTALPTALDRGEGQ